MKPPELGPGPEFDLIRRIIANSSVSGDPRILLGPGDDAAILRPGTLAISTDCSVEDVHFRRDWLSPREIGYRACAAALSDLAAMAARPIGLLASIAAPAEHGPAFVAELMAGVTEAATAHGAALLGGDLSESPGPAMVGMVVLGDGTRAVTRSGAKPGDTLWVTGDLGASAAAVRAWQTGERPEPDAFRAFARPSPRIEEALWLAERGPLHALIDLSDGLSGDAGHIAAASGVEIHVELARVPVSAAARVVSNGEQDALALAIGGGEDYELLFAGEEDGIAAVQSDFERRFGLRLTRVGTVHEGTGVVFTSSDGTATPARPGYSHFAAHAVKSRS